MGSLVLFVDECCGFFGRILLNRSGADGRLKVVTFFEERVYRDFLF